MHWTPVFCLVNEIKRLLSHQNLSFMETARQAYMTTFRRCEWGEVLWAGLFLSTWLDIEP